MNNLNPLTILDSLLGDWATPKVRRLIHGLVLLAVAVAGIWLAANGDWTEFIVAIVAAVYAAANKANTPATDLADAGDDEPDVEDGLSYEEAGGLPLGDDESALYGDGADRGARYDGQEPLGGL